MFLPDLPPEDKDKLTLYMELDDVLLHTYICDENFGYLGNPTGKDPEHQFFMEEIRQPVLVYMRDHWEEFMQFLKENEDYFDVVLYTSGLQQYTNHLMKLIDPNREVFKHFLYQNACYIFEVKDENLLFLIKDISRFRNRNIKRSMLLDPKPSNYMMTPENCLPVFEYNAEGIKREDEGTVDGKDPYLLSLIEELDEIKDLEDIRPTLHKKYNIR